MEFINCQECGEKIICDSIFCNYCGIRIKKQYIDLDANNSINGNMDTSKNNTSAAKIKTSKKNKKKSIILAIFFVFISLISILIIKYNEAIYETILIKFTKIRITSALSNYGIKGTINVSGNIYNDYSVDINSDEYEILYISDKYILIKDLTNILSNNGKIFIHSQNNIYHCIELNGTYSLIKNYNIYYTYQPELYESSTPTPTPRAKFEFQQYIEDNKVNLTAKEVQFNLKNNVGKLFTLSGEGTLDDYYNYGYDDDIEDSYFCMRVRPYGGSYSDEWYIYCHRESFQRAYDDLLSGNISVDLVCIIDEYRFEESQGNMASVKYISWR